MTFIRPVYLQANEKESQAANLHKDFTSTLPASVVNVNEMKIYVNEVDNYDGGNNGDTAIPNITSSYYCQ